MFPSQRSVGAYEILGELGRGGMGVVYRVRHRPTGALRAAKVLGTGVDPEAIERFHREAECLARVGGRGVVRIHETGLERGHLYFIMELIPGGSLRTRLAARGPLPWREAATLVRELALVLDRCHQAGVVHRDVKPDNVLLDDEGRPWLADFGCVRDMSADRLTQSGATVGTLPYMAPEQLSGLPVNAACDVYALGVLLSELVTGRRPFDGTTPVAQLGQRAAIRPRLQDPEVSERLDGVLDRALAPLVEDRTQTARELALDLEGALAGKTVEPRPARRRGEKSLERGVRWLGLGIAAVLVVALAALFARSVSPELKPAPSPSPSRSLAPLAANPWNQPHVPGTDEDAIAVVRSAVGNLTRLSRDRRVNFTFRDLAGSFYRQGIAQQNRELLVAARSLDLPRTEENLRGAELFWREALERDPFMAIGHLAFALLEPGVEGTEEFKAFAFELECFGELHDLDDSVPLPWLRLESLRENVAEDVRARGVALRLLRVWPRCPLTLLFESYDHETTHLGWELTMRALDSLVAPTGEDRNPYLDIRQKLVTRAVGLADSPEDRAKALELIFALHAERPSRLTRRFAALALRKTGAWREILERLPIEPFDVRFRETSDEVFHAHVAARLHLDQPHEARAIAIEALKHDSSATGWIDEILTYEIRVFAIELTRDQEWERAFAFAKTYCSESVDHGGQEMARMVCEPWIQHLEAQGDMAGARARARDYFTIAPDSRSERSLVEVLVHQTAWDEIEKLPHPTADQLVDIESRRVLRHQIWALVGLERVDEARARLSTMAAAWAHPDPSFATNGPVVQHDLTDLELMILELTGDLDAAVMAAEAFDARVGLPVSRRALARALELKGNWDRILVVVRAPYGDLNDGEVRESLRILAHAYTALRDFGAARQIATLLEPVDAAQAKAIRDSLPDEKK